MFQTQVLHQLSGAHILLVRDPVGKRRGECDAGLYRPWSLHDAEHEFWYVGRVHDANAAAGCHLANGHDGQH